MHDVCVEIPPYTVMYAVCKSLSLLNILYSGWCQVKLSEVNVCSMYAGAHPGCFNAKGTNFGLQVPMPRGPIRFKQKKIENNTGQFTRQSC